MEKENLHYSATGFLKDAAYTSYLYNLLYTYKDSFGDAESLTFNLEEIPPGVTSWDKKKAINFSDDGKAIVINPTHQKYTDTKGKITGMPDAIDVYQGINFILKKASKNIHYNLIVANNRTIKP